MNVFFNELTLDKDTGQNRLLLRSFRHVWAQFFKTVNDEQCRVFVDKVAMSKLQEATFAENDPELCQFVCSVMHRPFCPNDKEWSEEIRDRFYGSEYSINIRPSSSPTCPTMGWAYLNGSITLGFESSCFWKTLKHTIIETTVDGDEISHQALCVVNESHLVDSAFAAWVICQRDFERVTLPDKCLIEPEKKKIKYRDDHGREILEAFARKLVRSPYVIEIVNSLPWHPNSPSFIIDTYDDGIIDLCLHWYDEGYGLAVKTTAHGKLQAMKVAEVLRDEFDQGS